MATKTRKTKSEKTIGAEILRQFVDLPVEAITPDIARAVLKVSFSPADQSRVDVLSEKAREGSLTSAEEKEINEYIDTNDLLSILKSRAKRALKKAGLDPDRP